MFETLKGLWFFYPLIGGASLMLMLPPVYDGYMELKYALGSRASLLKFLAALLLHWELWAFAFFYFAAWPLALLLLVWEVVNDDDPFGTSRQIRWYRDRADGKYFW